MKGINKRDCDPPGGELAQSRCGFLTWWSTLGSCRTPIHSDGRLVAVDFLRRSAVLNIICVRKYDFEISKLIRCLSRMEAEWRNVPNLCGRIGIKNWCFVLFFYSLDFGGFFLFWRRVKKRSIKRRQFWDETGRLKRTPFLMSVVFLWTTVFQSGFFSWSAPPPPPGGGGGSPRPPSDGSWPDPPPGSGRDIPPPRILKRSCSQGAPTARWSGRCGRMGDPSRQSPYTNSCCGSASDLDRRLLI